MSIMTIKQQRAVELMVENGGNASKAMRDAGYSEATSKTPSKLTAVPEVQDALQQLLRSKGITLDKALQPIADGLTASKVILLGKGEDAFTEEIPDHGVRMAASDRALRLLNITSDKPQAFNSKELAEAIRDNVDEVELTRAVFRKDVPKPIESE